jgi:Domain of unknown function (DUF4157)
MATFADLFKTCYLTGGCVVEFAEVRLHYRGVDQICRAFGATALTVGSDIFFREDAFAPHTPEGLRILAHEVAHVVQQHRGPVAAPDVAGGLAVARAGSAEEHEAEAAADALLSGRAFAFTAARSCSGTSETGRRVVQRYTTWEHCLLGDVDSALLSPEQLEAQCALLERLGRDPRNVDEERLRAEYPGVETLRLPGSGLVVTLGELNVLPDYLAHPAEIETAPEAFLLPLIQSIRSLNITELRRSAGRPGPRPRLRGSLKYPRLRGLAEIGEVIEVDALGRRCGFAPWKLYSSAVGRNAGHFAPFSWHRWRSFHLMARELIARSLAAAGDDREKLRTRARIYAGYADHFLQDSYAAGHLVNKTLVMQWYIEWLAGSRVPCLDRHVLARMTTSRQPFLHGPDHYDRVAAGSGAPDGASSRPPWDPQSVVEAPTLEARIAASGVIGSCDQERRDAYAAYLAMLGSSVAQLAASLLHGYFNKRSLVVGAGPDGPPFRIPGDRTLLAGGDGALHAFRATAASWRAISELLAYGETGITCREIFEGFPDHVEQEGTLVTLRQWHDSSLRELCFGELFSLWRTAAMRILASAIFRRFCVPSPDVEALRKG